MERQVDRARSAEAYGLPTTYEQAVDEVHAWREAEQARERLAEAIRVAAAASNDAERALREAELLF